MPKTKIECGACGKVTERYVSPNAIDRPRGCSPRCGRILSGRTRSGRATKPSAEEQRKINAARQKARSHAWRAKGLCGNCGQGASPGHTLCDKHLEGLRVASSRRNAQRKAAGLCRNCGNPLNPETGRTAVCVTCQPAPIKGTQAEARRRKAAREQAASERLRVVRESRNSAILARFDRLTSRQQQILNLRFGLTDGIERTLQEVGDLLGVTRERIRQIEADALQRISGRDSVSKKRIMVALESPDVVLLRAASALVSHFVSKGIADVALSASEGR